MADDHYGPPMLLHCKRHTSTVLAKAPEHWPLELVALITASVGHHKCIKPCHVLGGGAVCPGVATCTQVPLASGKLKSAAIVGQDGGMWAQSGEFPGITEEQVGV